MNQQQNSIWTWVLCLSVPWISSFTIYFIAHELWLGLLGCFLTSSSIAYLGFNNLLNNNGNTLDSE